MNSLWQCFECGRVFRGNKEIDEIEAEQLPANEISAIAKLCDDCFWIEKATD